MIEVSGIQAKGSSSQKKLTSKDAEQTSAFDQLLRKLGQPEDEDKDESESTSLEMFAFLQQTAFKHLTSSEGIAPLSLEGSGSAADTTSEKAKLNGLTLQQHALHLNEANSGTISLEETELAPLKNLGLMKADTNMTLENSEASNPIGPGQTMGTIVNAAAGKLLRNAENLTSQQQGELKQVELPGELQSDPLVKAANIPEETSLHNGQNQDADMQKEDNPKGPLISVQPSGNSAAEVPAATIGNQAFAANTLHTEAGSLPQETIRAAQFDRDLMQFMQSAIRISGGEERLEAAFTLAPRHLGKVDVKITVQDGHVTAAFLTNTPLGKDLLETHVQVLRASLEAQGLQVGKIEISQQPAPADTTGSQFLGASSQGQGNSHGRQDQQRPQKHSEPLAIQTQEHYRDDRYEPAWVSQINTTA